MPSSEAAVERRVVPRLAVLWYGLGALMLLAVAVLSLIPVSNTGVNDKLSHLVTYFILAGWFGLLAGDRRALVLSLAGVIAYGGLLELLQAMTDYRVAEWYDLLANSIGALAGICLNFTPLRRLLLVVDRGLAGFLQR